MMTKINFTTPRTTSAALSPSPTIYRDALLPSEPRRLPAHPFRSSVRTAVEPDQRVSDGILLGLAALMLPTVVYSLDQACRLVSGGSLEHAIRAFLP